MADEIKTMKVSADMCEALINTALQMRKKAYCPYSKFSVGAALLCSDGTVYTGCNVENAAYSVSICAERTAFVKAVSDGKREFTAIAIAGGIAEQPEKYSYPCGTCRQLMREFCEPGQFRIIVAISPQDYRICTLEDLLPESFGPGNLV